MLAISVELLQGTFRADPDGTANTGSLSQAEWPPAPARLLAAMVAADGTRDRCRLTDGSELEWFERLAPPAIHAHGTPWQQSLRSRYVVMQGSPVKTGTYMEYVGRAVAKIRPGARAAPRDPVIHYVWDAVIPPSALSALRIRAARIGYLGTSDSPVRVRVETSLPEGAVAANRFVPDPDGDLRVRVTKAGDVRILDRVFDAWRNGGANVSRVQFPSLRHEARYRSPEADKQPDQGKVVAWLRLSRAISGRRVSAITSSFKKAVLRQHENLFGEPPPVLHGHGFAGKGYDLGRFLALPDAGYQRSRGRIHGLALWLPAGTDQAARVSARASAHCIRRLRGVGVDAALQPHTGEKRPWAAHPDRWRRVVSRHWVTVFPAVHERRGRLNLREVSRWCKHAGLPAPVAYRSSRTPLVPGGVDLAPVEVNRAGRPALPYSHVELWFPKPVRGPVVIGAARQRGLGLCVEAFEKGGANA